MNQMSKTVQHDSLQFDFFSKKLMFIYDYYYVSRDES